MSLHVVIIGGGIGGLTLAQGLKKAGVSVAVYERDRARDDRLQGYRIHITPQGCRALHDCLPAELYEDFFATTGKPNTTLGFYDHRLRELLVVGDPNAPEHYIDSYKSVSRISLRGVLLTGLDSTVHYGKNFTRYEKLPNGRVRAHFEDGTTADGDVLVAADGVNSRVRAQYLPEAKRVDTGVLAIAGKVPLTEETRGLVPPQMSAGPGMLFGPRGTAAFTAVHEFRTRAATADGPALELLWDNTADYIMWNVVTTWDRLGDRQRLERADGPTLQQVARQAVEGWSPQLHDLIDHSDPGSVSIFPFRTSTPVRHWEPSNITLLGDAIHNMPPTAGVGANTAILDARLLTRRISEVALGSAPLVSAIGDYEAEMRGYAFKAVATAMRNMRMGVSANPLGRFFTKAMFRFIHTVPPLRRKMSEAMTK